MRVQFVRVPSEGMFGATDKVLMCVSEVDPAQDQVQIREQFESIRSGLGVSAILVTDEVVRFEPAQPEPDMDCDTEAEPLVAAELWDEAVTYRCTRTRLWHGPSDRFHGPCPHISCALDHCKCEHMAVVRCDTCVVRRGGGWVPSVGCNHA